MTPFWKEAADLNKLAEQLDGRPEEEESLKAQHVERIRQVLLYGDRPHLQVGSRK